MEPLFRDSRPIVPRILTYVLAAVLIATLAFMVCMELFMETGMPTWVIAVSAVLFILVIAVSYILRMTVEVSEEGVTIVHSFRRVEVARKEIIEVRKGELGDIRNYGNWNLKGVRHRSYTCVGDDLGIAMKLTGKRVVVFSTPDPEALYPLIPVSEEE